MGILRMTGYLGVVQLQLEKQSTDSVLKSVIWESLAKPWQANDYSRWEVIMKNAVEMLNQSQHTPCNFASHSIEVLGQQQDYARIILNGWGLCNWDCCAYAVVNLLALLSDVNLKAFSKRPDQVFRSVQ